MAISDDIVATSSYDRSIKVWRLSDGALLKTLQDTNSVTALTVFKFSNEKNAELQAFSDEDSKLMSRNIFENPQRSIADLGFLLVSGGFDKLLKVWDFNLMETPTEVLRPIKEMRGHSHWITCIVSLEDEKNVVSGDDGGEMIIWEVITGK